MKTQYVKPVFVKRELVSAITAKPIKSNVIG